MYHVNIKSELAVEGPDGSILQAVQPKMDQQKQHEPDTDTVQELLAGNYSEEIVNEVSSGGSSSSQNGIHTWFCGCLLFWIEAFRQV